MKIYVVHANSFDFLNKLYAPLRQSELNSTHEIFLPHEGGKREDTKELIKTCDLVLAEVSEPSTGEGIELGRAEAAEIPILCIFEQGSNPAKSLKYITNDFIEYSNSTDMIEKISDFLAKKLTP